jgi:hypothetical protein
MHRYRKGRARSVEVCGAAAGSVVRGTAASNNGVRIRVLCEQPKERGGALLGTFVILDAGNNKHTHGLLALLGRETNAAEVLRTNRRGSPSCVSIVNANILVPEEGLPEGATVSKEQLHDKVDRPRPEPGPREASPGPSGVPGSHPQSGSLPLGPEGTACIPDFKNRLTSHLSPGGGPSGQAG